MGSELWDLGTNIVTAVCLYIIRPHLSSLAALYVWVPAPGGGAQLEERSARVISALVTGGITRATEPLLENKYIFGSVRSSRSHNLRSPLQGVSHVSFRLLKVTPQLTS